MTWEMGPLLGLDLETDGVDLLESRPCSFALVYADHGKIVNVKSSLIDTGREMPDEVAKIHGITTERMREHGRDLERMVMGIVGELMTASFARTPVVGMNARFDLTIIDSCYRSFNNGVGLRQDGWNGLVIDVSVIDRHKDKFRKGSRKLSALCEHYGVELTDAHTAKADTIATVQLAMAMAKKWPDIQHADPELLHVEQVAWRHEQMRSLNDYYVGQGKPGIPEEEGEWPLLGDKLVTVLAESLPTICPLDERCVLGAGHEGDCAVTF